jgi:hypothetical protein
MKYLIVIETVESGYFATVLLGCARILVHPDG